MLVEQSKCPVRHRDGGDSHPLSDTNRNGAGPPRSTLARATAGTLFLIRAATAAVFSRAKGASVVYFGRFHNLICRNSAGAMNRDRPRPKYGVAKKTSASTMPTTSAAPATTAVRLPIFDQREAPAPSRRAGAVVAAPLDLPFGAGSGRTVRRSGCLSPALERRLRPSGLRACFV